MGVVTGRIPDGFLVIGVVYRGNKEIDGALSRTGNQRIEDMISDMLMESKHRGQVRLILLDEKRLPTGVNGEAIWEKTGRPVLVLARGCEVDPRYMFHYGDRVVSVYGIDEESARRVLRLIYGDSGSEALRISGIILERVLELHNV